MTVFQNSKLKQVICSMLCNQVQVKNLCSQIQVENMYNHIQVENLYSQAQAEFMQSSESCTNDSRDDSESGDTQMRNNVKVCTGRYPRRERKSPAYLNDYVGDLEDDQAPSNVDFRYRVCAFPQTHKEAMDSPESDAW